MITSLVGGAATSGEQRERLLTAAVAQPHALPHGTRTVALCSSAGGGGGDENPQPSKKPKADEGKVRKELRTVLRDWIANAIKIHASAERPKAFWRDLLRSVMGVICDDETSVHRLDQIREALALEDIESALLELE